jgi:hypothetical protein
VLSVLVVLVLVLVLVHVHLLFFRHFGPILYPLDKSVGYETSGISCPTTYKHNHEVRWVI